MLDILSKPHADITPADVHALVATRAQESETLEFKEELPSRKGKADPWANGEDDIGDYAKRELLEESIAFANAYGGALVLGISDAKHVATGIRPVPRCNDLADRLRMVFRDCIDPQLPRVEIFAVETEADAGVVIIRVPRSRLAPHRNKKTLECPIRRFDRCERMTMREIQDMTLNVSRGLQRIDDEFSRRSKLFRRQFCRLRTPKEAYGLRFTAVPVVDDLRIDRLLHGHVLDPRFEPPSVDVVRNLPGQGRPPLLQGVQAYSFRYSDWKPRLRAARSEASHAALYARETMNIISYRELHCHGLVELGLLSVHGESDPDSRASPHVFPMSRELPVVEFASLAAWVGQVRTEAGAPTAEYAVEVQIDTKGPCRVIHGNAPPSPPVGSLDSGSTMFPRYALGDPEHLPKLLDIFERDFLNACGKDFANQLGNLTVEKRNRQ